jgi:Subtilase family
MYTKIFITILLLSLACSARTIHIAVPDTGYTVGTVPDLKVCPKGLIDLTGSGIQDDVGHGTNILHIIASELKDVDYCVYIYKIYSSKMNSPLYCSLLAYLYISYLPSVDIVNYSSSGLDGVFTEHMLINMLLKKHIIFVAAAGNNAYNLDLECNTYPACYEGVTSVGSLDILGKKSVFSNYGKIVKAWQLGENICFDNICMSGSSQATGYETTVKAKELYYGK